MGAYRLALIPEASACRSGVVPEPHMGGFSRDSSHVLLPSLSRVAVGTAEGSRLLKSGALQQLGSGSNLVGLAPDGASRNRMQNSSLHLFGSPSPPVAPSRSRAFLRFATSLFRRFLIRYLLLPLPSC